MAEGEFPFRSFTMRSEGYDRTEVDSYVDELRGEIVELRRTLESASGDGQTDTRLHDPEGAVTRTLAIAQETADRVLHDAQVEADRRRAEADEHATSTMTDADERAARLLSDIEAQAAEVREQGVAAARSAIQVERDKATAELSHVRRVRDDLRAEAVELKSALDTYRSQAREASDTLAAAASGPLMALDLPNFIDDDVVLAGIVESVEADDSDTFAHELADAPTEPSHLRAVESEAAAAELFDSDGDDLGALADDGNEDTLVFEVDDDEAEHEDDGLADVISIDADAPVFADTELATDLDEIDFDDDGGSGAFLAEVRAAAEDDNVALAPENDESDRFLSELREIADDPAEDLDSDAADRFFDDD